MSQARQSDTSLEFEEEETEVRDVTTPASGTADADVEVDPGMGSWLLLGGGDFFLKIFFYPYLEKWIQFDLRIFFKWVVKNHQLGFVAWKIRQMLLAQKVPKKAEVLVF